MAYLFLATNAGLELLPEARRDVPTGSRGVRAKAHRSEVGSVTGPAETLGSDSRPGRYQSDGPGPHLGPRSNRWNRRSRSFMPQGAAGPCRYDCRRERKDVFSMAERTGNIWVAQWKDHWRVVLHIRSTEVAIRT